MTAALLSSNWYRVERLRPRLRGHVHVHRHAYRGAVWYVIEDRVGGKYHRFNPASYRVISLMDGRRDLTAIWARLTEQLEEDTPAQEDVIRLLGQLHAADLIQCDVDPDVAELLERHGRQRRSRLMSRFMNPISLRFPLWDPDRALARMVDLLRPLAGARWLVAWVAVVLPALVLAPSHWPDLTENFTEQLLGFDNLVLMAVIFPLVKALHELGHGLAVRARGGEVHEMGVMLLVFFPIPYVEASAASAFVDKRHRMLVGAAGMLAEIFVAAIAFYLWIVLEPGLLRALAYNTMVLAGVTTVVFNANPLLRYDGYYVLADWAEIPNLATRANRYWQHLAERHLFAVHQSEPPDATPGERRWFVAYAPLAFAYRMFVLFGIALFVAQQYFFFGVLLAVWGLVASIGVPMAKGIAAVATGPQFAARGARIRAVAVGVVGGAGLLLFALPLPYHTEAGGVIWLPEQAMLRAGASGFVAEVRARSGSAVERGEIVAVSLEPTLASQIAAQQAKVEESLVVYEAAWSSNPAQASQLEEALRRERATLERLREEAAQLELRAPLGGTLLIDRPDDLPGRFVRKGEIVGYVLGAQAPLIRVVVPQADVDLVRDGTLGTEVKFPQAIDQTWPGRVVREVPKAGNQLPSPALGRVGGGSIAVDPADEKGTLAIESVFEFEIVLPADAPGGFLGSRVYVRFEHRPEPVGLRVWRALRRLFLSYFHV